MTEQSHQLGTVTGISGTSVVVIVDGNSTPVTLKRCGTYTTPAVGQRVLIAVVSPGDRVVIAWIPA